jgi:hypothetical protein
MTRKRPDAPNPSTPEIVVSYGTAPSPEAAQTLAVLRQAVAEALDRKRRLGQYAVFWQGGQAVRVEARDLPGLP